MTSQPTSPSFIMLAPMEGVIDHTMREMFSAIGGIDRCVTEFVRITRTVLPPKVFTHYYPEIHHNCQTTNHTPVYLQLLGDNPEAMAANAEKAANMGAKAIDLNFGCPAKTVNSHGGGAVLLQYPEKLYTITKTIRDNLPKNIPLTTKMRLGFNDASLAKENAIALQEAGASEIAIHARTKKEGYRPPAHWHEIAKLHDAIHIPIIANGEIWNIEDLQQCIKESGCTRIMLGRGLVACPDLALYAKGDTQTALHWGDISLLLLHYYHELSKECLPRHIPSLIKQWLVYLRVQYAEAYLFFQQVKTLTQPEQMYLAIQAELHSQMARKSISGMIGHLSLIDLLEENQYKQIK